METKGPNALLAAILLIASVGLSYYGFGEWLLHTIPTMVDAVAVVAAITMLVMVAFANNICAKKVELKWANGLLAVTLIVNCFVNVAGWIVLIIPGRSADATQLWVLLPTAFMVIILTVIQPVLIDKTVEPVANYLLERATSSKSGQASSPRHERDNKQ